MAATRVSSSSLLTGRATARNRSTRRSTARSTPRLTRTGLAPVPIADMPSRMIACARTVAVVVPSPTMSLVLIAASLTSCAPMFSNWFLRWISRAMVTPSLVTTGEPVIFSRMTLRPFGPSVDLTASASLSTPVCSRVRASAPNRSSLAMVVTSPLAQPLVESRAVGGVVGWLFALALALALAVGGVAVPQHAAADAGVRVQARAGQPGLAQMQGHLGSADRGAGGRIDQQVSVVVGREPELFAAA